VDGREPEAARADGVHARVPGFCNGSSKRASPRDYQTVIEPVDGHREFGLLGEEVRRIHAGWLGLRRWTAPLNAQPGFDGEFRVTFHGRLRGPTGPELDYVVGGRVLPGGLQVEIYEQGIEGVRPRVTVVDGKLWVTLQAARDE
jgi:hypothetical protein